MENEMSKEGNIDDIFKGKLSDMEVAPSDAVWGRIESDLDNKPWRKFWIFAIVLLLVSTIAIGGFFYEKPLESDSHLSEASIQPGDLSPADEEANKTNTNARQPKQASANSADGKTESEAVLATNSRESSHKNISKNASDTSENYQFEQKSIQTKKVESTIEKTIKTEASETALMAQITASQGENTNHASGAKDVKSSNVEVNPKLDSPKSNQSSEVQSLLSKSSDTNLGFEPEFMNTLSAEFPPISSFLKTTSLKSLTTEKNREWMVGFYAGVNWNLKNLNYDSQAQMELVESVLKRESNTTTLSYGALVTMKWKKNWRLTTGISYSKWCRKAVYPLDIPLDPNTIAGSPFSDYNTELTGPTGGQNVNVPNEQISDYESVIPMPTNLEFDLQVHECYEIISIPLRLGYEIFFPEFSLVPEIGLGYNRVIGNTIEANASNELDPIDFEKIEDYNKDMLSLSGSLGIERYLSPQFKIGVNGVYQYNVTPLYKSNQFSTHPYTISGQVRLWYIF